MIKKNTIKIIGLALYLPCLWLFIEGSSFLATYVVYSYIDKKNPTETRVLNLRPFSKHPLWIPDLTSESFLNSSYQVSVYDSYLSHRYGANRTVARYVGNRKSPDFGKKNHLGSNSYGFIHNGNAKRPPFSNKNVIKVLLLGGSSMAGFGASDNRCTIASFLERQLNSNSLNIEYEVLNAGRGGYYSPMELTYFVIELVNYKPDYVVALDGFNDFWHSFPLVEETAVYEDWAIPQRTSYQRRIEEFVNHVDDQTIIEAIQNNKRFRKILRRIFFYTFDLIAGFPWEANEKPKPSQNGESIWGKNSIYVRDMINKTYSHVPFFEKNWRSLVGAARANNIKPILLLQPVLPIAKTKPTEQESEGVKGIYNRSHFSVEQYENKIKIFYDEARQMIQRLKVSFPNSEEVVIEDISKMFINESESVFIDIIHYNNLGNRKIAELIASKISKNSSEVIDLHCNTGPPAKTRSN